MIALVRCSVSYLGLLDDFAMRNNCQLRSVERVKAATSILSLAGCRSITDCHDRFVNVLDFIA